MSLIVSAKKTIVAPFITVLFFFSFGAIASASELSAKIYRENSTLLRIEIYVGKAAPSNFIVQMFLPQGQVITEAAPPVSKFDIEKNSAKWLMRDITTGTTVISVHTATKINLDKTKVSVGYRNKKSGKFVHFEATKE